ncbi:hypothetical protein BC936DRAFT_140696 [Jimgerdemannia flammicorona]|uniref:Uncharacterized protein n=1 Tax=Jimgerdemannia flammicorona TaxID=994334 RepID=A0A433ADU3_9FUNG|nr:hypothetical protein BC936DRAFT_140696 [Jimgerdemannia flammicorona]
MDIRKYHGSHRYSRSERRALRPIAWSTDWARRWSVRCRRGGLRGVLWGILPKYFPAICKCLTSSLRQEFNLEGLDTSGCHTGDEAVVSRSEVEYLGKRLHYHCLLPLLVLLPTALSYLSPGQDLSPSTAS